MAPRVPLPAQLQVGVKGEVAASSPSAARLRLPKLPGGFGQAAPFEELQNLHVLRLLWFLLRGLQPSQPVVLLGFVEVTEGDGRSLFSLLRFAWSLLQNVLVLVGVACVSPGSSRGKIINFYPLLMCWLPANSML